MVIKFEYIEHYNLMELIHINIFLRNVLACNIHKLFYV